MATQVQCEILLTVPTRRSPDLIVVGAGVVGAACAHYAGQAVRLFPVLATVRAMRTYAGFRPYLPDHLSAIGPDPRRPGLLHACGHEGAGIGLAPATGQIAAALAAGDELPLDVRPFRPERFDAPC